MTTRRRVKIGFLVIALFALAAAFMPTVIPTHGLTIFEQVFLLCIPFMGFCLAGRIGPQRYWFYFGLACSGVALLVLGGFIFYGGSGRRYWRPDADWPVKAGAVILYASISPLLAAVIRLKLGAALKWLISPPSLSSGPRGRGHEGD